VGNVITVINTPNTTPNVSTPITTTLGSSITPLKFASGGLNPGYIAPTPFYSTTNDAQSKFYWGSHPYQTGGITGQVFDPVLYNTVPEAPRIPFGSQAVNQPLTSAQIAAIVANPGSNNSQQNTQQASSFVPAPVSTPIAPEFLAPVVQPPAPVQQPYVAPPPNESDSFGFGGPVDPATGLPIGVIISGGPARRIEDMPVDQYPGSFAPDAPPIMSQPVAPMTTPGLPAWMPPDTTTTTMPNGATGYNINGMIYDQTGSIISSGVGPVAP
jgi:hypothetical protein